MKWYEAAQARMKQEKISQEKLAEQLGVTQGAIAHWLKGRREPKLEVINQLLAYLGLPPLEYQAGDALVPGPEFTKSWQTVHIKGCAQLGPEGYWEALSADDGSVDVPSSDPDAYALRVKGESMMPAIRSGWVVWCEPNRELVPSEYVMVRTIDGQCMVKELLYINDREVSLMAVNGTYGRVTIPSEEVEQIHHVGGIVAPSKIRY
ncbi:Peptidase S24-like [Halopseudomonas litoralis]|uniref:Peptidase S24-like n=1 Tax=Halopseudomonas litoralis TaxID=797277 RepID=A0A1H1NUC2_9GAMM|nr:LexA family transcriptional regulator [Halopseudomonas litoralis]SDS02578.1 Peptidase S24-like [Halopseudomonas litoralis]